MDQILWYNYLLPYLFLITHYLSSRFLLFIILTKILKINMIINVDNVENWANKAIPCTEFIFEDHKNDSKPLPILFA